MRDIELPPHVTVDAEGVSASIPPGSRIRWADLERVDVSNAPECFWVLTGTRGRVVAPVEVVMGADELNACLLSLPGFDMDRFAEARLAEEAGELGEFTCWTRQRPRPWWKRWK
jgi:hypothetical protein